MTVSPAVRSALTTLIAFVTVLAAGLAADAEANASWLAGLTLAGTVLRTALAWVDKGNTSFGRGSVPPEPPLPPHGETLEDVLGGDEQALPFEDAVDVDPLAQDGDA
jgi:hypothetical protein